MQLLNGSLGLLSTHSLVGSHFKVSVTLALAASSRTGERVAASMPQYKDFPPGWGHIKVPLSSRRAAIAALGLYSPCRRRALWAQWAAGLGIRLFGPFALPGRRFGWTPVGTMEWEELSEAWRRSIGPFDEVAGYSRLQTSRDGMALLLLREGVPVAFVKLRHGDGTSLSNEKLALHAMWNSRPRVFQVPQPLGDGAAAGWCYLISAPLPAGPHRPPHAPAIRAIAEEVAAALTGLPRPTNMPSHWRPMHGDFTPWNLRVVRGGSLVLVDWENAGWGPPGADEVLYGATFAALRNRSPERCGQAEAVQFWRERLPTQEWGTRDRRLAEGLRFVLDRMTER